MRDPSIHIRLSDLQTVLSKLKVDVSAIVLAEACYAYKCPERSIISTNAHTKKKIDRVLKTKEADTHLFKQLLMDARLQDTFNVNFLKFIREGTAEYTNLREAAVIAVDYANEYGMTKTNGMQEFIKVGVKLMGKVFRLNKFGQKVGRIHEAKSISLVMTDEAIKKGSAVARAYFKKLEKETNTKYDGATKVPPTTYVNFIYAYEEIEEVGANPKDWVEAQFAGLAFMDVLPEIYQLHGENAGQRYIRYKFGKHETKGNKTEINVDVSGMDAKQLAFFKRLGNETSSK